jgi:hypothetical protein
MLNPRLVAAFRTFRARWRDRPYDAARAIAAARLEVSQGKAHYPPSPWPAARLTAPPAYPSTRYFESQADARAHGFRFVSFADDFGDSPIRHQGWHAGVDQADDVYRPAIFQIPGRDGRALYVAGYHESMSDGFVVDLSPTAVIEGDLGRTWQGEDDSGLIDAARMADSFAERQAEKAREYAEAWQAGQRFAELGEEIKEVRREALRLIIAAKRSSELLAKETEIRASVCTRIEELRNAIADARQQRADLLDVAYSLDLQGYFNLGAGSAVFS